MTLENRKSISNYRIISKLGEGGMGEVFLAEDPTLERKLAIKMLTDECCDDDERLGRFIREAKTASSLNHPNIITIFEFGKHEDSHFIATEFIDGRELSDVLSDEAVSLEETLDIAVQVASALTAAHSAGIIHRDIKPSNIMVRRDGIVKVLDFGLAKLTVIGSRDRENVRIGEDDKTLIVPLQGVTASSRPENSPPDVTQPGLVMGTPRYMSPEQARGKDIDHQTDIFSLGVVLYEMLAGACPFEGETISDVIAAVLTKDPSSLLDINSEAPPELESILKKSLKKDKRERYRSANELLNDLNHVKNELQVRNVLERAENTGSTIRISESLQIRTHERTESRVSIAVLPFVNMSANEGRDYFSEGLTEEINMNLSKLKMLRVVPRGTTMHYVNENRTHKQMAEDLGVRYLLEGSVRRHGEELRITAQLVDAVNQEYLWSDAFGGTIKDVFEIQEKVATEIALALKVTLSPDEKEDLKKRFTENTEAYQLYLQGRFFWNKRSEEGLKSAIKHFEKAIEIDKNYALAWAGIADSYSLLAEFGTIPHRQLYPLAEAAVKKALELDDRLAEVHTSYASQLLFSKWDWKNAKKEFERALELNPNYATAYHWYSYWFLGMGDLNEAIRSVSRAIELDPVSQAIMKDKGIVLYYDRQYDRAIAIAEKTLELDPIYPAAHRLLSLSYQGKGLYEEAIVENRKWGDLTGNHLEADFCLAQIYAVSGKRDNAKAIVENIEKQSSAIDNVYRGLGLVYTGLGEYDSALDMLEESFKKHEVALLSMKVDPKLDPLRDDPRFTALLEKLGVSQ